MGVEHAFVPHDIGLLVTIAACESAGVSKRSGTSTRTDAGDDSAIDASTDDADAGMTSAPSFPHNFSDARLREPPTQTTRPTLSATPGRPTPGWACLHSGRPAMPVEVVVHGGLHR